MVDAGMKTKNVVCIGGGVGTVNLLSGLKAYTTDLTVIVSMADDGGSSGRLRRLLNVLPLGDMVSCMAAMAKDNSEFTRKLLTYRFGGERYGKDHELGGHKLGNLILVALKDLTGSYEEAIAVFKKLFQVQGEFLPATADPVEISAKTIEGKEIFGEEKIDLGKYKGKRVLEHVYLHPSDAKAAKGVVASILAADVIIGGPGDLYTNVLPVLIVPEVAEALKNAKAEKIFVVNVANKPFETRGYDVSDYMQAITRHIGMFPFTTIIVNNNFSVQIPKQYHYTYVPYASTHIPSGVNLVEEDLVNTEFPLYHSSAKLAKVLAKYI